MMFHAMENESGNTSDEEINLFDPKIFIESLFKTRDAEIELILNTTTTTTTTANFTKLLNSDTTTNNNEKDIDHPNSDHLDYTLDVYLLIGAVSFVIFVILSVAMCKAINMLKISLQDGADDTVPVPAEQLPNQQRATGPPEMGTQSVASGYLLNGIRQFSATLRSRISLKSEDDLPPPYDEEAFGTSTMNQDNENEEASPPPYHVAITMTSENTSSQPQVLSDDEEGEEVLEDNDDEDDDQEISADETDSKVNFAAKKVRTPKLPKISS